MRPNESIKDLAEDLLLLAALLGLVFHARRDPGAIRHHQAAELQRRSLPRVWTNSFVLPNRRGSKPKGEASAFFVLGVNLQESVFLRPNL